MEMNSAMASQDAQQFPLRYPQVDDNSFRIHGHSISVIIAIIFSLVFFLILLSLCFRWVCDDGPSPVPCPSAAGIGAEVIKSMPLVPVLRGHELECSICLGVVAEGEKLKVLPRCRHAYHPECIDEWLRTHCSCPLCRAPLGEEMA